MIKVNSSDKMSVVNLALLLQAVLCLSRLATVRADCSTNSTPGTNASDPLYPFMFKDWVYPAYGNSEDKLSERVKDCGVNNGDLGFYNLSFPIGFTIDGMFGFFSCKQIIAFNDTEQKDAGNITKGELIPYGDLPVCCDKIVLFQTDKPIFGKVAGKDVNITIDDQYDDNAGDPDLFVTYCEEFWACTEFIQQFSEAQCIEKNLNFCLEDKKQSLCFNKAYDVDETGELALRKKFILEYCCGLGDPEADLDDPQCLHLDDLAGEVHAMCKFVYDLDQRFKFKEQNLDDAGRDVCEDLIECRFPNVTQGGVNLADLRDDVDWYDICNPQTNETNLTLAIEEVLEDCRSTGNMSKYITYAPCNASTDACDYDCEDPLPVCPPRLKGYFDGFNPQYPKDEGTYKDKFSNAYTNFIPFSDGDPTQRSSSDTFGWLLTSKFALQISFIIVEAIKRALPDDPPYFFKIFTWSAVEAIVSAIEGYMNVFETHDGFINAAELEATYENTRQMLDGSAAIFEHVHCRCAAYFRDENDDNQSDGPPLRGQGCNSRDDNCDFTVDDCAEDKWKPDLDTGLAVARCSNKWFKNKTEAIACADSNAIASDDCDPNPTVITRIATGVCANTTVALTVKDRCGNEKTKIVPVKVDGTPPLVSCGFGANNDTNVEYIQNNNKNGQANPLFVNLKYDVSDNCGGDLHVSVKVYSNELESVPNANAATLYHNSPDYDKVDVLLMDSICRTNANSPCVTDPGINEKVRLYTVDVSATDAAGNSNNDVCTVLVKSRNAQNKSINISDAKQRFLLAEHSSILPG